MNKLCYKLLGVLIVVGIISGLFYRYHLGEFLGLNGFNHYKHAILLFEEQHIIGFAIIYTVSYIVLIACCIPGTILLDLIAGFIYGPLIGTILVLCSYSIGAFLNFSIVRLLFKDIFQQKFAHLHHILVSDGTKKRLALNLLGLRFIPIIPFWLINILAAILEIPALTFIVTTFIGIIPTSIIYVMLGDNVSHQLASGNGLSLDRLASPQLWLPLTGLALLILTPNLYKMARKYYFSQSQGRDKL